MKFSKCLLALCCLTIFLAVMQKEGTLHSSQRAANIPETDDNDMKLLGTNRDQAEVWRIGIKEILRR